VGWESENINNIPKWATAQPHGAAPMGSPYFFTAKTGRCKVKKRWSNICVLFQGSNLVRPLHREPSRSLALAFLKMLWPQVQLWKMFWMMLCSNSFERIKRMDVMSLIGCFCFSCLWFLNAIFWISLAFVECFCFLYCFCVALTALIVLFFLKVCEMLLNVFNFFYSRNTYYISFGMLMNWDEFCGVFWNALHRKCHSYTLDWSKTGVESWHCSQTATRQNEKKRFWMFRYGNISSPAWLAALAALAPISPALDAVEWAWTRTHARKNATMNAWNDAI
jgi:hypothetical protein